MNYQDAIRNFIPGNEQETKDRELFLDWIRRYPDILLRTNELVHMTASSWIVNRSRTKILLVYHNIYQSWSWTGGHADGDSDLLAVSIREGREETGLYNIRPLTDAIFSLENLCVNGHVKKGKYVSSHLHANVTYLLEADDSESLAINQEENSGVAWFPIDEVLHAPSEAWMVEFVYRKLQDKLQLLKERKEI